MATDPLGRAMYDYATGGGAGDLIYRDGAETEPHDVPGTYFTDPAAWSAPWRRRLAELEGPVLDAGCGAGQHAIWLESQGVDLVGIDRSPNAVEAARRRGLTAACVMDMFEPAFDRNRFRSALVVGTQSGLSGSLPGIRAFLTTLARITDPDGVAIVDSYDPAGLDPESFIGYRPDPRAGIARRTFHFEYARPDAQREVGPALDFVLFGPDRLRDVVIGTRWTVSAVWPQEAYYRAKLEKASG